MTTVRRPARTRFAVATVVTALLVTACGSTVQLRSGVDGGLSGDGLSAGTGATGSASGSAIDPTTGLPVAGSAGSLTGGGGGGTSTTTTRSGSPSVAGSVPVGGTKANPPTGGTIEIGSEYVSQSGLTTAAKAFGVDLDLGPLLMEEQAMVAYLNGQGGVNRAKVKLVPFEVSTTDNSSTNSQAACSKWTQDNHVLAAFTATVLATNCLAQKNAIEVQGYNSANTPLASQLGSTPLLTIPNGLTLDRLASTYGTHMGDQGFFSSPANEKLGVVYNDTPNFTSAFGSLKSALSAKGVKVVSSYAVPAFTDASSAASIENAVGNAVLQFRSAGITHVMFLDNGTTASVFFAMAAQNQSYYPRYGLNGGDAATIFASDLQNDQQVLAGTQVVGFTPTYDTYKTSDYENSQAKACGAIYSKAGVSIPSGPNPEAYSLMICDAFLYIAKALTTGGANTPAAFVQGRSKLANGGYTNALTFGVSASPDGVRSARIASFSSSCTCFSYVGPKISL